MWAITLRLRGNISKRDPLMIKTVSQRLPQTQVLLPLYFLSFLLICLIENEDIITLLRKLEKESESQTNETFGFDLDPLSSYEELSVPDEEFLMEAENENEEEICDIAFTQFISRDIKTVEEFNLQKYRILHSHVFFKHFKILMNEFS